MKSFMLGSCLLLAYGVLMTRPVAAHHSAAMFDEGKVIELKGTIKEMQWKNPHIWIQVLVPDKGATTEWSLEGGSPNSLSRNGWKSTTFSFDAPLRVRTLQKNGSFKSIEELRVVAA